MEEHHDYIALDPNQLSANEWIAAYDDIVAHAVTSTDGVQLRELSNQCYGSHQPITAASYLRCVTLPSTVFISTGAFEPVRDALHASL